MKLVVSHRRSGPGACGFVLTCNGSKTTSPASGNNVRRAMAVAENRPNPIPF
jgi:hypothetical protein